MMNTDLTVYRERLFALRAKLLGDATQMEDDALTAHIEATSTPTDREELGTDTAEQELTSSLLGNEKDVFDQIDGALLRIEDRSYGQCEQCGEKIPESRLEAIPYAAECERCASQREKGHEAIKK